MSTAYSLTEGTDLFRAPLLEVGRLATAEKTRRYGDRATYILNRHLNPTNLCVLRCPMCAFSRSPGEEGAFCLTVEEAVGSAVGEGGAAPDELHITAGLHPSLPFAYALELLSALKERLPTTTLKAFTAVEIEHWARAAGIGIEECLLALKAAGLHGLTGGGAEIFSPRVRALICPGKISGARWLEIHGVAHGLGITTTATMLYGHVETVEERAAHLLALREQQARSGGFTAFVALAYQPEHTALGGLGTTGRDDLQTIAAARLLLDNIPYIKAYWPMLGVKTAQLALAFGADDLDGTVVEERIGHAGGAASPRGLAEADLRRLIAEAGCTPVRRDAGWNLL